MPHILILHGPNLNLLGSREPEHYGADTLQDIDGGLARLADQLGVQLSSLQSNAEHVLVEKIQQSAGTIDYIIINPAAFTHTSIAIRDALSAVAIPFIEIHLSNVHAREDFRRKSCLSDLARGVISGLGPVGYQLALRAAVEHLSKAKG
jgi:3-dehydroquinate dehydratase-2